MQKASRKSKRPSDYQVGYGRPPKATQFKKGVSGNRKGRPKGRKNIATLFQEAMYERVPITENGQRRTITKIEAIIKQMINKAATGDPKAFQATLNVARELGGLKLPLQPEGRKQFTLRVFEKDPITGERFRMKPGTTERMPDDANE